MSAQHRRLVLGLCVAVAACLFLAACRDGTLTAPSGSMILLDANPPAIGLGEQSEISALVTNQDGNPVGRNVEILFFTSLGSIDSSAQTNAQGVARVTLRSGSTTGTAVVRAVAGATEATIEVQIGPRVGTITLQASPGNLPNTGGESQLIAVVRDSNGRALEGAAVNFATQLGRLDSGGGIVETDARGEARDRVVVTADEARGWPQSSFEVLAATPGPDGSLLEATFSISIQALSPTARFTAEAAGGNAVRFRNQSTGREPLSFAWDFQSNGTIDSTAREPVHTYANAGNFTVTLVVTNAFGSDTVVRTITVPVP